MAKQEQQQPFYDIAATEEETAAIDVAEAKLIDVVDKLMASFRPSKNTDHALALGTYLACRLTGHFVAKHIQRNQTVSTEWRDAETPEILAHALQYIFMPQIVVSARAKFDELPEGPVN